MKVLNSNTSLQCLHASMSTRKIHTQLLFILSLTQCPHSWLSAPVDQGQIFRHVRAHRTSVSHTRGHPRPTGPAPLHTREWYVRWHAHTHKLPHALSQTQHIYKCKYVNGMYTVCTHVPMHVPIHIQIHAYMHIYMHIHTRMHIMHILHTPYIHMGIKYIKW